MHGASTFDDKRQGKKKQTAHTTLYILYLFFIKKEPDVEAKSKFPIQILWFDSLIEYLIASSATKFNFFWAKTNPHKGH